MHAYRSTIDAYSGIWLAVGTFIATSRAAPADSTQAAKTSVAIPMTRS